MVSTASTVPLRTWAATTSSTFLRSSSFAVTVVLVTTHELVPVFIPAPGVLTDVAPGSGVVGQAGDERFTLYYEGNLYGAANVVTWADRTFMAAGRMLTKYPTTARCAVDPDHVILVGHLDPETGTITVTEPSSELTTWLGTDDLETERFTTGALHVNRRYLSTVPPGPHKRLLEKALRH